jgi:hypothetical protein
MTVKQLKLKMDTPVLEYTECMVKGTDGTKVVSDKWAEMQLTNNSRTVCEIELARELNKHDDMRIHYKEYVRADKSVLVTMTVYRSRTKVVGSY